MKPLTVCLVALVALLAAATIASAATGGTPTPTPSVTVLGSPSPEPTESPSAEPTGSPSAEPSESPSHAPESRAPKAEQNTSDEHGNAPDFSACEGLTGLDNAICHHQALLQIKPHSPGLNNSLDHLHANLAKHAAAAGKHAKSGSEGSDS